MRKKNEEDIMTGSYESSAVTGERIGEKIMPRYPDSVYTEKENYIEVERRMMVGKQPIIVRSFFMADTAKTPTQKMLSIIDSDAEKATN